MPEVTPEQGASFAPIVWVEFDSTDGTVQAWAMSDVADPSSYYHGFKTGKVLEFGRVIRALSDEKGNYETQKFSVDVSDAEDRYLATLLGADATRLIVNRRLVLRLIDDVSRRALLTPLTVAIGLIRSYRMS